MSIPGCLLGRLAGGEHGGGDISTVEGQPGSLTSHSCGNIKYLRKVLGKIEEKAFEMCALKLFFTVI